MSWFRDLNDGNASSTSNFFRWRKRKFQASESSEDESKEANHTDGSFWRLFDTPSTHDTRYPLDLHSSHVDATPSKKRKLEECSFSEPSLVDSVVTLGSCQNVPEILQADVSLPVKPLKRRARKETMSVIDRKKFLISTPTKAMVDSMERYVSEIVKIIPLRHFLYPFNCWLHPLPPQPSRPTSQEPGAIRCHLGWKDSDNVYHAIGVNYGIVALLVKGRMTAKQKAGFVHNSWHLSHLCGNRTCCNWSHFTVEPGPVNISRNSCLLSDDHRSCTHYPRCMRDKKLKGLVKPLNATEVYQRNSTPSAIIEKSPYLDRSTSPIRPKEEICPVFNNKRLKRARLSQNQ